jgi:dethiobiotin synthetase
LQRGVKASKDYGLDVMGLVMNGFPPRETAVDKQLVTAVKNLAGVEVLCVIPKIAEVANIHFKLEDIIVDKILRRLRVI